MGNGEGRTGDLCWRQSGEPERSAEDVNARPVIRKLGKEVIIVNRALGAALQVLAVVVWIQFVANQLYDPMSKGLSGTVWDILNPILVLGLLVVMWVGWQRKRAYDSGEEGGLSTEYFEANLTLYVGIALFHLYLWNWSGKDFSAAAVSFHWVWILIDIAVPLILLSAGRFLVKRDAPLV